MIKNKKSLVFNDEPAYSEFSFGCGREPDVTTKDTWDKGATDYLNTWDDEAQVDTVGNWVRRTVGPRREAIDLKWEEG